MEFSLQASAVMALYLVVGLKKAGLATGDQASEVLKSMAESMDMFARDFPDEIKKAPEGAALQACATTTARLFRERSVAILYGSEF